ncbi:unnamed protein product [Phaeothamnion confervicola]
MIRLFQLLRPVCCPSNTIIFAGRSLRTNQVAVSGLPRRHITVISSRRIFLMQAVKDQTVRFDTEEALSRFTRYIGSSWNVAYREKVSGNVDRDRGFQMNRIGDAETFLRLSLQSAGAFGINSLIIEITYRHDVPFNAETSALDLAIGKPYAWMEEGKSFHATETTEVGGGITEITVIRVGPEPGDQRSYGVWFVDTGVLVAAADRATMAAALRMKADAHAASLGAEGDGTAEVILEDPLFYEPAEDVKARIVRMT